MANFCRTNKDRWQLDRSAKPCLTPPGEARRDSCSATASLRSPLSLVVLSCAILVGARPAFAEQFNFDSVTLPTDLVADIVNIEDDIALDDREQANRNAGIKVTQPVETVASEPSSEPETTVSVVAQTDNSSGSIFSNIDTGTEITPDLIVAETNTETITEDTVALSTNSQSSSGSIFSDIDSEESVETETSEAVPESETMVTLNTEVEPSSDSISSDVGSEETRETVTPEPATESETTVAAVVVDESAEPIVDNTKLDSAEEAVNVATYSPATKEIPAETEITIASNEIKDQPPETSSIFDNVPSEPEEMPVLVVEQPVSASDAADIPQVLDESQGVIVVAESSVESAAESSPKVASTETESPTVTVQQGAESASEESDQAEPQIIASSETVSEPKTETMAAAEITPEPAPSAASKSDQVTETPATTESTTEIASSSEAIIESGDKTELAEKKLLELAENIETETVEQSVTAEQEASINEDEIIIAWATAWSNNQTEDYLAFYADAFQPADKNLDRDAWEQIRRKRLQNKNIRIIVSNAEVYRVEGDIVEVRFTQRYTSSSYKDRVIKSIEMTETDKGWQFLSERTIEELPFE